MRWRRRRGDIRHHAEVLAATARMEMDLEVGDWRDTIRQMNELLEQVSASADAHRSETGRLTEELRRRVVRLEGVIHRRELEYDTLIEQVCELREESYLEGVAAARKSQGSRET